MNIDEEKIKEEIAQNTAMQAFLKKFTQSQVTGFLSSYIPYKKMWMDHGNRYSNDMEEDSIKWVSRASWHLQHIQQKKLFDAQCLWRAEKIQMPEVQLSYDFNVWEHNILNCPFIDPISPEDIDLYAQYLLITNPDSSSGHVEIEEWQDHKEIIEAYQTNNENINFPEWYDFYNGRRGAGVYMTLPDIRGPKEDFYMTLWNEKMNSDFEKKHPDYQPKPMRHLIFYDKDTRDWFVKTFENKQVQRLYTAYEWNKRNNGLEEELEPYMDALMNADEPLSMPANMDWVEAIKEAANKYTNAKIAEALPEAWEQYQINLQMNIAFDYDAGSYKSWKSTRDAFAEMILEGRKLNGEPGDFDF